MLFPSGLFFLSTCQLVLVGNRQLVSLPCLVFFGFSRWQVKLYSCLSEASAKGYHHGLAGLRVKVM